MGVGPLASVGADGLFSLVLLVYFPFRLVAFSFQSLYLLPMPSPELRFPADCMLFWPANCRAPRASLKPLARDYCLTAKERLWVMTPDEQRVVCIGLPQIFNLLEGFDACARVGRCVKIASAVKTQHAQRPETRRDAMMRDFRSRLWTDG